MTMLNRIKDRWTSSRLFPCLVAAAMLALVASSPSWAQDTGRKVAILVGINKYDGRLRDLDYAERDVTELGKVLKEQGFEVRVLIATGTGDDKATLANVEKAVKATLAKIGKKDLLLIGLAGHGFQLEVPDAQGKLESGAFFCPVDARKGDPATMLSISKLIEQIDDSGASANLLLVDACREDPSRGRGLDGSTVKLLPEGVAALLGCRANQQTFESDKAGGGHGIFFHFVIEGLKGAAANPTTGEVSWLGLVEYVTKQVPASAQAWAEKKQTPNHVANLQDVPVLARVKLPDHRLPDPRPSLIVPAPAGTPVTPPPDEKGKTLTLDLGGGVKLVTVRISAGKYSMGSPKGELGRSRNNNEDIKSVTIEKDFFLGETEVTQAQWQAVMETTPWKGSRYVKEGDAYPAAELRWRDAQEFMAKASKLTGKKVRLPLEKEWEYACRAGTKTRYSFGDSALDLGDYAWYADNTKGAANEYSHQVRLKKPNAWGLFDMHGNVREWCEDHFGRLSYVQRGGSWYEGPSDCRAAHQGWGSTTTQDSRTGFRILVDLSE